MGGFQVAVLPLKMYVTISDILEATSLYKVITIICYATICRILNLLTVASLKHNIEIVQINCCCVAVNA